MTNEERGEVQVEGKDGKTYTLRPSLQSFCFVQNKLKKKFGEVEVEALEGDSECLRALLWAYLQAHHREEAGTFEQAAEIVDQLGVFAVMRALGRLMELNKPPEKDKAPAGAPNPPTGQAERGTGVSSTSPVAASA